MLIFHHADADGRCAAAIARMWLSSKHTEERCVTIELDYKQQDTIKPELDIAVDEMVCILDFSFKLDMMRRIEARTNSIVWCDHHASAKSYGYKYNGLCDFTDKGLCGAECTWKYFLPLANVPNALELLGDYDSWRMARESECKPFYEGLKLYDTTPASELWRKLLTGDTSLMVQEVMVAGASAIKYRDNYCAEMRNSFGYEAKISGNSAFVMNVYRFGSGQFGELFAKYPICAAYVYDGKKYTVSLYSQTVDVSVIAKSHGGGGHCGAAGFVCETLPF